MSIGRVEQIRNSKINTQANSQSTAAQEILIFHVVHSDDVEVGVALTWVQRVLGLTFPDCDSADRII